jgi:hypothetical protein
MVYPTERLEIADAGGDPVPHTFLRQPGEADHLALVLPGTGYTGRMALLHYPTRLLLDAGADALRLEYDYLRRPAFRALPDAAQERRFFGDVEAAARAALARRPYARLTLIGKSVGTLGMGHLLDALEPAGVATAAVWLTPLLRDEGLRRRIAAHRPPSVFVIGTADPHYDPALLEEVRGATGGRAVLVEGADHGLECPGDVWGSLRALERTLRAVAALAAEAPAGGPGAPAPPRAGGG